MNFSPFVQKHLSKVQFWTLFGFSRFLYSIREAGIFVADAPRWPLSPILGGSSIGTVPVELQTVAYLLSNATAGFALT